MTLFEGVLAYVRSSVQHQVVIEPEIVLQLLTAAREASDAHLSRKQQAQLDGMIATVIGDIVTDNK